jgi:cytochrome c biogenesis protein ResB
MLNFYAKYLLFLYSILMYHFVCVCVSLSLCYYQIEPIPSSHSAHVSKLTAKVRSFQRFAHLWRTASDNASEVSTEAVSIVGQCLDLLDDIKKVTFRFN